MNLKRLAIYVKRSTEMRSCNHCCCRKAINFTYSECVCSLRYPGCKYMRRIILSVSCQAVPYFSTYLTEEHGFQKKLLNKKCVLIFPTSIV